MGLDLTAEEIVWGLNRDLSGDLNRLSYLNIASLKL